MKSASILPSLANRGYQKDKIMSQEKDNQSEVARIRQQIQDEQSAAYQGLHGLSQGMSQHAFITRRMERMGILHDKLKEIVGEQEAAKILAEALDKEGKDGKDV
jgi:aspartate oxidase